MSLAELKQALVENKTKVEQLIEKAQSGGDDTRFADLVANRTVSKFDNSITQIASYALRGCKLSDDIDFSNIESIGSYGMYGVSGVSELSFPNLKSIGTGGMYGVSGVSELSFPNLETMGDEALRGIKTLVSVSIPKIKILATSCLNGTTALKNVYAPEVTTMKMSVFGESGIEHIDLPKLISMNGNGYQFTKCYNLKEFRFYNNITGGVHETTFNGCSNLRDIYVPWAEGEVAKAPWGATNATIHYNYTGEE